MSDASARTFNPLVIGVMIAVGVFAFAAFFVLSAYAPSLRDGTGDGRANALSESAVGYAALADLLDRTGTDVILARSEPFSDGPETLTVLTPQRLGKTSLDVPSARHNTLIVMPKWQTRADPDRPGWIVLGPPNGATEFRFDVDGHLIDLAVMRRGDQPRITRAAPEADEEAENDTSPGDDADADAEEASLEDRLDDLPVGVDLDFPVMVRTRTTEPQKIALNPPGFDFGPALGPLPAPAFVAAIASLQTVSGEHIEPVWTDEYGRIVLGRVTVHPSTGGRYDFDRYVPSRTYVLADPDFANTMGLSRAANARAARDLVAELSNGRPVRLDLTAFGYSRAQNLLTVALEPPFLAASLSALLTALLLAFHATARFGPPAREREGFALGKAALADNTATLLSAADKARTLGPRYAALTRRRIARAFGMGRVDAARLDERAQKAIGTDALARATRDADTAATTSDVLGVARRLYETRKGLDA